MAIRRVCSRNEYKADTGHGRIYLTNLHYLLLMHQEMNSARKNILIDFTYDASTFKKNIADMVEFVLSNVPKRNIPCKQSYAYG